MKQKSQNEIDQFLGLVRQGEEAWEQAGLLLIALHDADEHIYEKIIAQSDGLKFEHLLTFERIGRKELYPRLLLDEGHAAKRVSSCGLSFDKQKELCENPIPVATLMNGEVKIIHKRLSELTQTEARRVIGFDGVRPQAEQAELLLAKDIRKPRYVIQGDKVYFTSNTTFTRAQLEEVLAQLPKPTGTSLAATIRGNAFERPRP